LGRDNWERKLANPARVAVAPAGGAESHTLEWFRKVMAWGQNTVFGLRPGYDVKLLESNGRGADSFAETIKAQDNEMIIAVAGQTVTTDGGAGFSNADVHKSIRADLIQATAQSLAYTVNTQGIPAYVASVFGEERLDECPVVDWDTTPPKDLTATATALAAAGQAITSVRAALAEDGLTLDTRAMCSQYGIPLRESVEENPGIRVVGEAA
jgi:phage gp29-like protein